MNIWLVSYQEETGSTSHEYHMLLSGQDFRLAEAACERMGENGWPPERPVCSQGCYWQFDRKRHVYTVFHFCPCFLPWTLSRTWTLPWTETRPISEEAGSPRH